LNWESAVRTGHPILRGEMRTTGAWTTQMDTQKCTKARKNAVFRA
jgi:hypothetical protein